MEFCYNIAGSIIKIVGQDKEMNLGDDLLDNFRCESERCDRQLEFFVVEMLSEPKGICIYKDPRIQIFEDEEAVIRYVGSVECNLDGAYIRIKRRGNVSQIEVKRTAIPNGITSKVILNSLEVEHFVVEGGGIILHSSYIVKNEKAVLFTAPSETGKSTQAALWAEYRNAEIYNGDRAVVIDCKGTCFACGIPYAGSSGIAKQGIFPLSAIVYLGKDQKTQIKRLSGSQAFRKIWEGVSVNVWDESDVTKASTSILNIISKVPVFYLSCTPDESAIIALEKELGW